MKKILLLLPLFFACQGPKPSQNTEIIADETVVAYSLTVEGMTCTGCENTIKNSLSALEGVAEVTASHELGLVTITLNPEKADTAKIREKITETGYTPIDYFKPLE